MPISPLSLAQADLTLSRIAYGCMKLGDGHADPTSPEAKRATIDILEVALEAGITTFDHADIYRNGRAEQAFSALWEVYPNLRDQIQIQSKCGIRLPGSTGEDSPGHYDFSFEHIVRSAEGSVQRLGVDHLDILLLHRPDALMEPDEIARAFRELHDRGLVRAFGVSNFGVGQMRLLQQSLDLPLVANQLELNPLHAHLIDHGLTVNVDRDLTAADGAGLLDTCRLRGVLVQAWSPLARGRLSRPLDETDERDRPAAQVVLELSHAYRCSREAIVIAWLLRHPAGIQPVIGTGHPGRLLSCCEADGITLTREEWYRLTIAARGAPLP